MIRLVMPEKKFGRGENPKSWAHAKHNKGRPKFQDKWGSPSVTRNFSVTKEAVDGLDEKVRELGFENRSDYIQHVGIGLVPILPKELDYEQLQKGIQSSGFPNLEAFLIAVSKGEIDIVAKEEEI